MGQSNLLTNPSFENGMAGWTVSASTAIVDPYGAPGAPVVAVGAHIGGGDRVLRDQNGGAHVEQVASLAGVSQGMNLRVGGFFGGTGEDSARLVILFLDGAGTIVQLRDLPPVTRTNRNFEDVLMIRETILPIPAAAASVMARVEFTDIGCCSANAAADAIFVVPVDDPVVPAPREFGAELLVNRGFENGWAAGSPLRLIEPQGWEGIAGSGCEVKPYSDVNPEVPTTIVSCLIGGGSPATSCMPGGAGNLLSDSAGGNAALRQRIDVRGNLPDFSVPGSVALRVSGFLGGVASLRDTARIDVRFLDANMTSISPVGPVGPVTRAMRNSETVVVFREKEYFVPQNTNFIEIDATFTDLDCCVPRGLLDNVSAMLVVSTPAQPVPKNVNLLSNSSFEEGDLPGSPLELVNPDGWFGVNDNSVEVKPYGQDSSVPSVGFAQANELGGLVLKDAGGGAVLRQFIDLSGDQAQIAAGELYVHSEAWLGGVGTVNDTAELRIRFVNAAGGQVGGAGGLTILGPVTAADRGNVTSLLPVQADVLIPPTTAGMEIDVHLTDVGCCAPFGLADKVVALVYVDGCVPFCSALPNATGSEAILTCSGDPGSSLVLTSAPVPNTPGQFFFGPTMLAGTPFGDGLRCVGGATTRIQPFVQAGMMMQPPNTAVLAINYTAPYAAGLVGTKHFQHWFRSGLSTGSGFNLSNGLSITF